MKKSVWFLISFLICSSITIEAQEVNVFGTVILNGEYKSDSIYVGLYPMSSQPPGRPLPKPYYFSSFSDSSFSFKVEPGQYTVGAIAFGYQQRSRFQIYIPPNISNYQVTITLHPDAVGWAGENGEMPLIKEVQLDGEYNKGKKDKRVSLTKEGDIWKLYDLPITLKEGQRYRFYVNGRPTLDFFNKKVIPSKNWLIFHNIYTGNEIIFDPSIYNRTKEESTIDVNGFELNEQFSQIVNDISQIENDLSGKMRKFYSGSTPPKKNVIDSLGRSMFVALSEVEQKYDPIFSQLFVEQQLKFYSIKYASLDFPKKAASDEEKAETIKALYLSDSFGNYFKGELELIQKLDPNSYLLSGDFLMSLLRLQDALDKCPELSQKFNLSEKYFDEFLDDFINDSPNERLSCNLLFRLASMNSSTNEEKAKAYIDILKNDYPYKKYIDENAVERLLARLIITVGKEAPAFSVKTLKGESLKLANCKGKFVLLDFWGSWCAPCREEIPHLKKLYTTISREKLEVIGIAQDDSIKLCNYIEEQNILYPNVLASKQLITTYGVSAFPTSYLIDPNGIIIRKNLRGEKGMQQIMEEIDKYF